jgi:hypothetical protein
LSKLCVFLDRWRYTVQAASAAVAAGGTGPYLRRNLRDEK